MNTRITTKFTVVTEQSMDALLLLTKQIATEKFSDLLEKHVLQKYIAEHFSEKNLIIEINSMANQWLVVYANDEPAGYARITSKGKRPAGLEHKRVNRIADLGILKKYTDPAIKQSLFDKCMAVCKSYEALWINEYTENPLIDFFEAEGFVRQTETNKHDEIPLPSVCLIKEQG